MPKNETQLQTNSLDLTKKSTGAAHHPSGNVAKFHTFFLGKANWFHPFQKTFNFWNWCGLLHHCESDFHLFPKVCQKRGIQITPNVDLMVGKSMNFLNCILEAWKIIQIHSLPFFAWSFLKGFLHIEWFTNQMKLVIATSTQRAILQNFSKQSYR